MDGGSIPLYTELVARDSGNEPIYGWPLWLGGFQATTLFLSISDCVSYLTEQPCAQLLLALQDRPGELIHPYFPPCSKK